MRRSFLIPFVLWAGVAAAAPAGGAYHVVGTIPGPDGGWDYARVDPTAHRLYVAHGDAVMVVDLANDHVTTLGPVRHAHAVVPLAGNRLAVTSGDDATVRFFDTSTGRQIGNVAVGKKPDAAIPDPAHHRLLVMNATGGSITLVDTDRMQVDATIAAKPGLEFAALAGDTLFVNDEDTNEIEVVDLVSRKTERPIALDGCEEPSGLAYDRRRNILISACANGKAAVVDGRTRRLIQLLDIDKGPDAVILDEARRLAFIPCGKSGMLDILALTDAREIGRVGRIATEPGARTGALDPATGALYLPTAKLAPATSPGGRPNPLPGTFHVLIVKPAM